MNQYESRVICEVTLKEQSQQVGIARYEKVVRWIMENLVCKARSGNLERPISTRSYRGKLESSLSGASSPVTAKLDHKLRANCKRE